MTKRTLPKLPEPTRPKWARNLTMDTVGTLLLGLASVTVLTWAHYLSKHARP